VGRGGRGGGQGLVRSRKRCVVMEDERDARDANGRERTGQRVVGLVDERHDDDACEQSEVVLRLRIGVARAGN
jgi:hypothetical protein